MQDDPYELLGVSRDASDEEIEEAYRERAKQYHPDVCERDDATEMFKRVKRAYETIISEDGSEEGEIRNGETESPGTENDGDFDAESFDVHETYDDWSVGRRADGWYVFSEAETAPHVEETVYHFLNADGSVSSDPVRFESKEDAETAYRQEYGEDVEGGSEDMDETDTTTEETSETSDDETIWGETRRSARLDSLWRLCYQEGRTQPDGQRVRRWGITTDVTGDDRYINPDGEYQETEFWYPTEKDARDAYEGYVREMKRSRSATGGAETGSSGASGPDPLRNVRRHPVVLVALEALSSVVDRTASVYPYVSRVTREARSPLISFLHYVTFPRLAAFTKNFLRGVVIGYVILVLDTFWGTGVLASALGEGVISVVFSGMFPLFIYFSVVILLFAALLQD